MGGIFIVIYADVLFVINFFITFLLLQITAKLSKKTPNTIRLILSSAIGGAYSFIIFLDELPTVLLAITKIVAACIIVLVAFKFHRLISFLLCSVIFIFSSFIFLGIIVALCFFLKLDFVAVNNSVIYFNISAMGIIAAGTVAYLLSCLIVRIYNRTVSQKEIYTLIIENKNNSVSLFAFLDTGNRLREPFSDSPVIIVDRASAESVIGDSKTRLVPVTTVNSSSLLTAFKPEKIILKSSKSTEVIENAYIALSDDISSKSYSAILNPEILSI